jgi:PAS domain S-box-containing protein
MIVSMSHDGIMVVDSEGKIEFANNACCEMSSYTKEEIINKPVLETIDPEYTEFMVNRWNEVQAGESGTYETVMVKKDGTRKNLLVSHNNVEINGQQKYVAIIKDISTGITEYINAIAETLKN